MIHSMVLIHDMYCLCVFIYQNLLINGCFLYSINNNYHLLICFSFEGVEEEVK